MAAMRWPMQSSACCHPKAEKSFCTGSTGTHLLEGFRRAGYGATFGRIGLFWAHLPDRIGLTQRPPHSLSGWTTSVINCHPISIPKVGWAFIRMAVLPWTGISRPAKCVWSLLCWFWRPTENCLAWRANGRKCFLGASAIIWPLGRTGRSINYFPTRIIRCRLFAWDFPAPGRQRTRRPHRRLLPLTPLKPAEFATGPEQQARNALVAFFDHLDRQQYSDAAALFGGEANQSGRVPQPGESLADFLQSLCTTKLFCLPVAEITDTIQVSENEYLFYVVFVNKAGTRLEGGACCGGDPAAAPTIWQFAYPVEKIDGAWKVMRLPLYFP